MEKIVLRKSLVGLRKSYDPKDYDSRIYQNFIQSDLYNNTDKILCYISCGFEVSTTEIIKKSLKDNKIVAVPKCIDFSGNMIFKVIRGMSDLSIGAYNIPEPNDNCFELKDFENAVCIVPGLAFSGNGYRIGYGKGYYDRFLRNFCGISVGICYNKFMCEELPYDKYDIAVNCIITEYPPQVKNTSGR